MKSVIIRSAETTQEREWIFRLRYDIYVKEMGKLMPGADCVSRMLQDEFDNRATHLMALDEGQLVGSLRIIWGGVEIPGPYWEWYGLTDFTEFPASSFSFTGRLMVLPGLRNGVAASALACQAFRLGCERGVKFDFIHTTSSLVGLFEKLGHRRYRSDFLDPNLGHRIPMVLMLEDREHLEKCRSPLLRRGQLATSKVGTPSWFAAHFLPVVP